MDLQAGGGAVPPAAVGIGRVREPRDAAGVEQVGRVPVVDVALEVLATVGLLQRALVVLDPNTSILLLYSNEKCVHIVIVLPNA